MISNKSKQFCDGINANASYNKDPVQKSPQNNIPPNYEMKIDKYLVPLTKLHNCVKDLKSIMANTGGKYFLYYYNLKQMREPLKNMGFFIKIPRLEELFNIFLEDEKLSAENKKKFNIRMLNMPQNNVNPIVKSYKNILYSNLLRKYKNNTKINKNNIYKDMSPLMKAFHQTKLMDDLKPDLESLLKWYEYMKEHQESKTSTYSSTKGFFKRIYTGKSKMTVMKERTVKQFISEICIFLIRDVFLNLISIQRNYLNEFISEQVALKK